MKQTKKITILHSNDLHGDFLAEQVDEKLVGGVSMLSGYIEKVRAEEPNTIYAIAGDMFRGSVIDSEYKGLSTIEIMNALAPDIVTIGNHEVDYGIAHLLFIEKCARFPIINANLYIKSVMQEYGETTDQQKAVGAWLCGYAEHKQPFDEIKHRHTLNEVGDVAEGKYDWKIERGRGLSM